MKSNKNIIVLLATVMTLLLMVTGCQTSSVQEEDTITIGFIGPLTGDLAHLGQNAKAAAEIAAEEINANGGINGKKLKIIYENGKCNEKEAVAVANKLIHIDNVPIIVGSICSRETMSFAPIAEENKRVVVSYCTSAPALREAGDYIFRTVPNAAIQGEFAANELKKRNFSNVAILACNDHYCGGISDAFQKEFETSGTIVARESFEPGTKDLRTEILKIKESQPDAIYFIARTGSATAGMKQIQEAGMDVFLFGPDIWDDKSLQGKYDNAAYSVTQSDLPEAFINKLQNKGKEISNCAPQSYDAVKILAKILEETEDPTKIKEALYAMDNYEGISGNIKFDEKGDILDAKYVVKTI
jgi:branched-chain amino acid transport system substrate-binding protein